MKKIIALLAAAAALILLASCGSAPVVVISPETSAAQGSGVDKFAFEYNGVSFHVGDLMESNEGNSASVKGRIGEPVSYSESNSCAYQGLDKVYTYPGFTIYTYPDGNKDYVLMIVFSDDSVSTGAGIRIGSTVGELADAYGDSSVSDDKTYTFESPEGTSSISFKVAGGIVKNIQYLYSGN